MSLHHYAIFSKDKTELEVFYYPIRHFKAIFPTLSGLWSTKASQAWVGFESKPHSTS